MAQHASSSSASRQHASSSQLLSSSPSHRAGAQRRLYRPGTSARDREEWHARFLTRCADRIRTERAQAVAEQRGHALSSYAERDEAWSMEEEAIIRRMILSEARKQQWALERQADNHAFSDVEQAIAQWEQVQAAESDLDEEIPPDVDLGDASFVPTAVAVSGSNCPHCRSPSGLATDEHHIRCTACGWNVSLAALASLDQWAAGHGFTGSVHQPFLFYDAAVGTLGLCSACDEQCTVG